MSRQKYQTGSGTTFVCKLQQQQQAGNPNRGSSSNNKSEEEQQEWYCFDRKRIQKCANLMRSSPTSSPASPSASTLLIVCLFLSALISLFILIQFYLSFTNTHIYFLSTAATSNSYSLNLVNASLARRQRRLIPATNNYNHMLPRRTTANILERRRRSVIQATGAAGVNWTYDREPEDSNAETTELLFADSDTAGDAAVSAGLMLTQAAVNHQPQRTNLIHRQQPNYSANNRGSLATTMTAARNHSLLNRSGRVSASNNPPVQSPHLVASSESRWTPIVKPSASGGHSVRPAVEQPLLSSPSSSNAQPSNVPANSMISYTSNHNKQLVSNGSNYVNEQQHNNMHRLQINHNHNKTTIISISQPIRNQSTGAALHPNNNINNRNQSRIRHVKHKRIHHQQNHRHRTIHRTPQITMQQPPVVGSSGMGMSPSASYPHHYWHRRPRFHSGDQQLHPTAPKVYKRVLLCDKTLVSLDYVRRFPADPHQLATPPMNHYAHSNEIIDEFADNNNFIDLDGNYATDSLQVQPMDKRLQSADNGTVAGVPAANNGDNIGHRAHPERRSRSLPAATAASPNLATSESTISHSRNGINNDYLLPDDEPLVKCDMWDLEKGLKNRKPPLHILSQAVRADFDTVRDAINRCRQLSERTLPPEDEYRGDGTLEIMSTEDLMSLFSMKRGLLPGTKWCGLGDQADSYNDLGPKHRIDICCRAHDHCPIRSKPFRNDYGILNIGLYTKSHCDCDADFYRCLREARSRTADMLGNLYFNVMKLQCMREERMKICREVKPIALGFERCVRYEDSNLKRVFKFTSPPVAY